MNLRGLGALPSPWPLCVVDQASKQWLLRGFDIAARQPVRVAPVLDLVLAWNKGISYSLFTTDSRNGPWILLGVTLAATVLLDRLALALDGDRSRPSALGLLIGGALGNAYDRFAYGAVVDFVYFHVGGFSWYIFNGADCAIVAGRRSAALRIATRASGGPRLQNAGKRKLKDRVSARIADVTPTQCSVGGRASRPALGWLREFGFCGR